jgi:endogenous inhibitor of DNA gyrase (YacG/DUF329 family)
MIENNCAYCQKSVIFGIDEVFTLKVELLEEKRIVSFCSKKCMENNLSNLNAKTPTEFEYVIIKEQKVVSKSPFIMFVRLEPKPLRTEIISVN